MAYSKRVSLLQSPKWFFSNLFALWSRNPILFVIFHRENDAKVRKNAPVNDESAHYPKKRAIVILGKRIPLPQSVIMRRALGGAFVAGGSLGFLPVLGFWMIPVGLIILSHDSHRVRRLRRKSEIHIWRKWLKRRSASIG